MDTHHTNRVLLKTLHTFSGNVLIYPVPAYGYIFIWLGVTQTVTLALSTAVFQSSYLIKGCFTSWIKNQMCFEA